MIEISVAMTSFNGEKFLRDQLESLYKQTRVPDEIIVCDDQSTDKTVAILQEFHEKFGLTYYVNEKKLGVNKNFEKAIRLCKGRYVALCDQDDVWFQNKIEKMLTVIQKYEENSPCVISSQVVPVKESVENRLFSRPIKDSFGVEATLLSVGNVQGCTLMLNDKMVRILKPFPESYKDVMMYDGYISFVSATCGVKYNIGEPLMFYRLHKNNVFGKTRDSFGLIQMFVAKIRFLKYNRMFLASRSKSLAYIYDEYDDIMLPYAKKLVKKMIAFETAGVFQRIRIIFSMSNYSVLKKIAHSLCELILYYIPIKNR